MVTRQELQEFLDNISEMEMQLRAAKFHIKKVIREKRAFTDEEIECMRVDHIIGDDK